MGTTRSGRPGPTGAGAAALRAHLRDGAGDERADVLDDLARQAADPAVLEVLLWAIDELDLARPAIRRLVVAESDVDDVAQDVLVAVAESISGFRGDARFTTWLHQVARFKAIAYLRRQRDQVPLSDDDVGDARRMSSLIATRATVQRVVDELPERYRDPVRLRDIDQLPYEEVAVRLGIPPATARTRVARGRALAAARLRTSGW